VATLIADLVVAGLSMDGLFGDSPAWNSPAVRREPRAAILRRGTLDGSGGRRVTLMTNTRRPATNWQPNRWTIQPRFSRGALRLGHRRILR
jgi:hypothetical protein